MARTFTHGPVNGTEERLEALLQAQERTNELLEQLVGRSEQTLSQTIDLKEPVKVPNSRRR